MWQIYSTLLVGSVNHKYELRIPVMVGAGEHEANFVNTALDLSTVISSGEVLMLILRLCSI